MTFNQRSVQGAFRRLGFVAEALLADYVEDASDMPCDLVIISCEI